MTICKKTLVRAGVRTNLAMLNKDFAGPVRMDNIFEELGTR
jgi:hypothetical protein